MAEKRIYEVQYVEGLIAENERLTARDEVFLEKIIELEQQNTRLLEDKTALLDAVHLLREENYQKHGHKTVPISEATANLLRIATALTEAEKLQDNDT